MLTDNVVLQSLLIIVLFTFGGAAGALLARFIFQLMGKVDKADAELDKTRIIQRKVYQVAIDALKGMKATTTLELYRANYRAFRDAITDAETLQMESAGIWRAQALLDVLTHKELPDEETLSRIGKTELELIKSLDTLIDEEGAKSVKQTKAPKARKLGKK
jgi:hypothetical protein